MGERRRGEGGAMLRFVRACVFCGACNSNSNSNSSSNSSKNSSNSNNNNVGGGGTSDSLTGGAGHSDNEYCQHRVPLSNHRPQPPHSAAVVAQVSSTGHRSSTRSDDRQRREMSLRGGGEDEDEHNADTNSSSSSWQLMESNPDLLRRLADSIQCFSHLEAQLGAANLVVVVDDDDNNNTDVDDTDFTPTRTVTAQDMLERLLSRIPRKDEESFRLLKRKFIESGELTAQSILAEYLPNELPPVSATVSPASAFGPVSASAFSPVSASAFSPASASADPEQPHALPTSEVVGAAGELVAPKAERDHRARFLTHESSAEPPGVVNVSCIPELEHHTGPGGDPGRQAKPNHKKNENQLREAPCGGVLRKASDDLGGGGGDDDDDDGHLVEGFEQLMVSGDTSKCEELGTRPRTSALSQAQDAPSGSERLRARFFSFSLPGPLRPRSTRPQASGGSNSYSSSSSSSSNSNSSANEPSTSTASRNRRSTEIAARQEEVDAHRSPSIRASGPTEEVEVRLADEPMLDGPDIYRMMAKPRGLCVIFNMHHFKGLPEKNRPGSEQDEKRMERLFHRFGFTVRLHSDQTSDQVLYMLETYASQDVQTCHDAFVCIIMSHGEQHHIYGSDYNLVKLQEIFEKFNNVNCPILRERPKLFFIQACRGDRPDNGCPAVLGSTSSDELEATATTMSTRRRRNTTCSDASGFGATASGELSSSDTAQAWARTSLPRRIPSWSDVYIAYAVTEGYESMRDMNTGSWFLKAVYEVMARESHRLDLDTLMERVCRNVMERSGSVDGQRQCPEVKKIGWQKKLYFNPGWPQT